MSNESESVSPEDTISILVATDCHLGYAEKDPVRQNDSFNTFEEILQLAQEHKVDMILLGGDLFHDNKPSRKTIHRTVSLLRQYCMGDKECQLEFVSDPSINFAHCDFKSVNYQDPNFNIAYPLFSVHGNHDDPTGDGFLSAIDILSTAGLLNHFGKATSCDNIDISPVLLKKGNTKLALYGLGAMRDERLHKTFIMKRVKMLRPKEDTDSWFNIFVIHQNRAKHGPKNYIPESFLDEFLDLVVWGHEHECLIEPTWSESAKPFYVTQPGSSVATSLSVGESKQKHVGLLEIQNREFRIKKLQLKTVRHFVMEEVVLSETGILEHEDDKVYNYLSAKVEQMIEDATSQHTGHPEQPEKPLIRVKVEYSGGYEIVNPHRFGQQFVDRVANNKDILLFHRKKVYGARGKKNVGNDEPEFSLSQSNSIKMEDLINEYLNAVDEQLQLTVLSERKLSKALNEFVLKDEKDAIPELVKWQLRKTQEELNKRNLKEDMIDKEIEKVKAVEETVDEKVEDEEIEQVLESARNRTSVNGDDFVDLGSDIEMDDDGSNNTVTSKRGHGRGGRGSRGKRGSKAESQSSSRGTRGRWRARGRGATSQVDSSQKTVHDSFISTGRSNTSAIRNVGVDRDDPRSSRIRGVQRPFVDSDEEENPFDFDDLPSKKRQRR